MSYMDKYEDVLTELYGPVSINDSSEERRSLDKSKDKKIEFVIDKNDKFTWC